LTLCTAGKFFGIKYDPFLSGACFNLVEYFIGCRAFMLNLQSTSEKTRQLWR
jgi:hypothetical protein